MKIRVEIISEQDTKTSPEGARQAVNVAIHERRGDMFNVATSDTIQEGSDGVFLVPLGGRLVIDTPQVREELVYDRDQAASVRMSNQVNVEGRADTPDLAQIAKDKQIEADRAAQQAKDAQARKAEAPTPAPQGTAGGTPGVRVGADGKPLPQDVAKQQQTTAARPPGEKPPLPGSPVGSPPHGNEGKK